MGSCRPGAVLGARSEAATRPHDTATSMDHGTDAEVPPIKAVVFDLDGLMFNTESVFNRAGTELLRRRGKEPHPELFKRMMGRRPVEGFAVMIELMSLTETYEELLFESEQIFTSMLDGHL